jgi:hypothetical protein
MIYLKTGIGIELRGEDMLIASLQSNFSGGTFTHFKRIAGYRLRAEGDVRNEINPSEHTGSARIALYLEYLARMLSCAISICPQR